MKTTFSIIFALALIGCGTTKPVSSQKYYTINCYGTKVHVKNKRIYNNGYTQYMHEGKWKTSTDLCADTVLKER